MKNKKTLVITLLTFAVIIIGAAVLYNYLSAKVSYDSIGESTSSAADITVTDESNREVNLSDMKGKPVILNFWASWCGPCQSEMPIFDKIYDRYKNDINFMMVNLTGGRETKESASEYIKSQEYSFPVYYDTNGEGAMSYETYSIPVTYFIDADGNIAGYVKGALSEEALLEGIDMISGK